MDKSMLNLIAIGILAVVFFIIEGIVIYRFYKAYKERKNKVDFKLPELEEEKEPDLMPSKPYSKVPTINKKKYSKDKTIFLSSNEDIDLEEELESQYNTSKKKIKIIDLPKL